MSAYIAALLPMTIALISTTARLSDDTQTLQSVRDRVVQGGDSPGGQSRLMQPHQ